MSNPPVGNVVVTTLSYWCCFIFFATFACLTARGAWMETYYGEIYSDWHEAPGTIIVSKNLRAERRIGSTSEVYVMYEYRVDGRRFEGDRVHWMAPIKLEPWDRTHTVPQRMFPLGKQVTVYYSPEKPHISVLNKNADPLRLPTQKWFLFFAVPALLILRGLLHPLFTSLRRLWG